MNEFADIPHEFGEHDWYENEVKRTMNTELDDVETVRHALHGIAAEAGEIHSIFQKIYQGHPFDGKHLKLEVGDLLWNIDELIQAMGWTLDDVMWENVKKLRARYPDGFSTERSLHREEGDI